MRSSKDQDLFGTGQLINLFYSKESFDHSTLYYAFANCFYFLD